MATRRTAERRERSIEVLILQNYKFLYCILFTMLLQIKKVKVVPSSVPSSRMKVEFLEVIPVLSHHLPQVAFSRARAIQRLGGRSIRRTCSYLRRILQLIIHVPLEVRKSAESAVAIRSEFFAKGNYANAQQRIRSCNLMITSQKLCQ